MAVVSEWIAREYFEMLGFLVVQPTKYQVTARSKRPVEQFDFAICRTDSTPHKLPKGLQWTNEDLFNIRRAVVSVRGWHSDRFTPSVLDSSPEIFHFAAEESMNAATELLGEGPTARILCVPGLPKSKTTEENALWQLREGGIDGVLVFRSMLKLLIEYVEPSANYEKSDLLQLLRLLKHYDLLREDQLELFRDRGPQQDGPTSAG